MAQPDRRERIERLLVFSNGGGIYSYGLSKLGVGGAVGRRGGTLLGLGRHGHGFGGWVRQDSAGRSTASPTGPRNSSKLLEATLEAVETRGLLSDIGTLHRDRGYDNRNVNALCDELGITDRQIARQRRRGEPKPPTPQPLRLGRRWTVERTNSWLSNFGQLRRNTDRRIIHRHAQIAFAVALLLIAKVIDWHKRADADPPPIR
jgi:transposase